MVELYLYFLVCLHGVALIKISTGTTLSLPYRLQFSEQMVNLYRYINSTKQNVQIEWLNNYLLLKDERLYRLVMLF
jgi:hypothetical protein